MSYDGLGGLGSLFGGLGSMYGSGYGNAGIQQTNARNAYMDQARAQYDALRAMQPLANTYRRVSCTCEGCGAPVQITEASCSYCKRPAA